MIRKCLAYSIFVLLFVLCLSRLSQAQESPKSFTLDGAVNYAINNNYQLKNTAVDITIAKRQVWETTAIGLPQVSGTIAYQYIPTVPTAQFPATYLKNRIPDDRNVTGAVLKDTSQFGLGYAPGEEIELGVKQNTTYTLSVNQLVFSGEYIVGLQASRTFKQLSNQNYIKNKQQLREQVANAYFLVVTLKENLETIQQSLKNLEKIEYEMQEMYKEGFIEETEVDQIKLNRLTIENTVQSLERQVGVSKNGLKFQMGMDLDNEILVEQTITDLVDQANASILLTDSFIVSSTIDYQLMETQEQLSELSFRREKSKLLPVISAFYQHQELAKKADFDFTMEDIIGVNLSMPVFTSGSNYSKIQQAKLELEKTKNNKYQAGEGLLLEYQQTRTELLDALDKMNNQLQMMELSQKIYDRTILKYKEGVSSSLDLTQAQNQYLTSRSDYYNTVMEYLSKYAKFERILTNE